MASTNVAPLKWHDALPVGSRGIPGHDGYAGSPDGHAWSYWAFKGAGYGGKATKHMGSRWRKLNGSPRKEDGRERVTLRKADGTYRRAYISIFILETFVGPCPEGMECCHNDGDCLNNAVENLRWDTRFGNIQDKRKHGTLLRGTSINTAKLTEDDVLEIRATGYPLKPMAKKFGVSKALIGMVLRRKIWTHI